MNRNIYIDNIDLHVAKKQYLEALKFQPKFEVVNTENSLSRITQNPIYAKVSSPFYNASAMDGIAVICERTYGASEIKPVELIENIDFIFVNTGNIIKEPYNSVIMIEDITILEDSKIRIIKGAFPWQHIRPIGEDIVAQEMILTSGHKIRGIDLGALLSGGIQNIEVYKQIRIGILPTGNEIINNINEIEDGKIIDSNSAMFEGLITEYGGIPRRYNPVKDDYEKLKAAFLKGINDNDLMIVNAGSSAGSKDFTANIISDLGEVLIHGIAIKPGKPTILGIINNKPIIGIPGYPVSAYISFENFVKPLMEVYSGNIINNNEIIKAKLAQRVVSSFKHEEKVRVTLGYINNKFTAVPLSRGAGTTMSLVKADGILTIPKNCEGLEATTEVEVELLKSKSVIKKTLVSVGSHDIIMDLLSDKMALSSSHVGSMGGIMALKRGECHISPIHLLDEKSGDYNIEIVKKYFKDKKMVLIKGVKRAQGFIVKKGNPKEITGFKDLIKENISYVNRQRGAGTRVLLDYNITKYKIDTNKVIGYQRVMPTHMAVAIAVKSETADVGLGIKAAATSLDLDFIEVTSEDYDFVVEEKYINNKEVKQLISLLKSKWFKHTLNTNGGYKTINSGEIIYINSGDSNG